MKEAPWDAIGYAVLTAASGLIGIVTGVKVHGVKISSLEDRLDRIENKLDRMIERQLKL